MPTMTWYVIGASLNRMRDLISWSGEYKLGIADDREGRMTSAPEMSCQPLASNALVELTTVQHSQPEWPTVDENRSLVTSCDGA